MKIQTSRHFLAKLATRRRLRAIKLASRSGFLLHAIPAMILLATSMAVPAFAATIHTMNSTGANNWSTASWTNGAPTSASAGDLARYAIAGTSSTTTLDVVGVRLGALSQTSSGQWTITGTNALTLDNLGAGAQIINNTNSSTSAAFIVDVDLVLADNFSIATGASSGGNGSVILGVTVGGHTISGTGNITLAAASVGQTNNYSSVASVFINDNINSVGTITDNIGSAAFSDTIAGNIGSNVTNVTHNPGVGRTLILSGTNSYGTTTISSGTLQIGNGGTTGSLGTGAVTDNGTLTFKRTDGLAVSNLISGSGGVTLTSGSLTLSNANTYTGLTSVSGGTLIGTNPQAFGDPATNAANQISLGGSTAVLSLLNNGTGSNGTIVYGGPTASSTGYNVTVTTGGGSFNVGSTGSNTGNTIQLGTLATNQVMNFTNSNNYNLKFGAVTSTSAATFTNNMSNGTLTLASFTDSAASTQTLTFNGSSATATTAVTGVIAQNGANNLNVTQSGLGTLVLSGANTYTGSTTASNGTLKLDFSAAGAPTGATGIITGSALKLGGGTVQIVGASGGSTETFASTSFTAATGGRSVISAAPVAGGTIPTVNLGTLTGTQGALVRFDGAAYNSGASSGTTTGSTTVASTATYNTTTNTSANGIISSSTSGGAANAYATVGLYDWAAISTGTLGTAQTGAVVGGSQISGFYTTTNTLAATSTFGLNIDLTGSATMFGNSTSVSGAYGTIRFNAAGATTLTIGKATGNAVVGALLVTPNVGANNTTIAPNGAINLQASRSTNAATGLTVWQNNTAGELLINAPYSNGSSSATTATYTQGGPGTVVLGASNTYTGLTYLDGGTTVISTNDNLGLATTAASVNMNGGSLLATSSIALDNGTNLRGLTLNGAGGSLSASNGNTLTVNGVISGAGSLVVGSGTLAGTGSGTANATPVVGSGTVALTGFNSFTGDVNVNAGILGVSAANNSTNPTTSSLGNNQVVRFINVNNGGTLSFNNGDILGGSGSTIVSTLVINAGGTVTNNGASYNTLGPVALNGGTLTGNGGSSNGQFQMYAFGGTVTVGGTTASTISSVAGTTSGGTANSTVGFHLGTGVTSSTTFNVADATGSSASDLNVSASLIDRVGGLGAASLVKLGAGTMTLSGTNTYTGTTTVDAGTLLANNATSSTGTGAVNVNAGTLGGTGTVSGAVMVLNGATLMGGAGAPSGALTLSTNPTLNSGSIIELTLGASGAHSTLALAAGGFNGFNTNQAFTLDNIQTGTYDNIITGVASGIATGSWTVTNNAGFNATFTDDGSNIDLSITAVPETSTFVGGLLLLGVAGFHQRRRLTGLLAGV